MKKWSLLSIPLVGFAGITVWAQAVVGAPTGLGPGVIVTEGAPRHSVQELEGSTGNRRLTPATDPAATPRTTSPALKSPALKSAPLSEATPSPLSPKAEEPGVEFVEPAQVTSPAPAPTDDSVSSSQLDDKGGLSSNNGRSGSSNG
ncbi:hypothetical protein ACHMXB_11740 [Arthrobacter sp. UC242_113]|uniref:hypothetical protein n=1 Tax=Arthrobacter sp. UC242_113 TaxID=3374550 RepID=UPI003757183B